jgi:hypothetical protein
MHKLRVVRPNEVLYEDVQNEGSKSNIEILYADVEIYATDVHI